tara:strand:- start:67 stop:903 length:837 start_codon:yes stop_codon:yes gene_type:complete
MDSKKIIYDVGAHKGDDSFYYLKRGFRVVAFECAPSNINYLKKRFTHEIKNRDFILEEKAVTSGGGNGNFIDFFVDDDSEWGTVHSKWASRNVRLGSSQKITSVETIDPPTIYSIYGLPHYMKIDIEGSDIDALTSLFTLKEDERPKFVSLESNKTSFKDLQEELSILVHLGYTKFAAINQERIQKKSRWISDAGEEIYHNHKIGSSGPFGIDLNVKWKTQKAIQRQYARIFIGYKLFGDDGLLAPRKLRNKLIIKIYSKLLYILHLSPGWYDTHATK